MKKYIPFIALGVLLVAGGIYYAVSAQKSKNQNTNSVDHAAMGHDMNGNPVDQSHRSYNIQLTSTTDNIKPGQSTKISYKITNDKSEVLKDFAVVHEKIMHFILVRKDLQGFQHLHPDYNQSTGEFSVNVTFPTDGPYRLFPDFTPASDNPMKLPVTVTYDVNVGDTSKYKPQTVIADTDIVKTAGIYSIDYYFPDTIKSQEQVDYSLSVGKSDEVVTLEPYLGAMGHGVIIKEGALDFIHTHAGDMGMEDMGNMDMGSMEHMNHQGEPDTIEFSANFPEPGIYRIFTQFQVKGQVITTSYTVKVQ